MADPPSRETPDVETRVEPMVRGADFGPVAEALARRRTEILARWLQAAGRQPFHEAHPDGAVADDIPTLLDAVVDFLGRTAAPWEEPEAPLEDPAVIAAAQRHAAARFSQGLTPLDVVTEFRLLRQEISRALRVDMADDESVRDTVAANLVVNDALDGAMVVALRGLTERVEQVREEFFASTVHDVRQPVSSVVASLNMARRWLDSDDPPLDQLREVVAIADAAAGEMAEVVELLSDASRAMLGAVELALEPCHVEAVVAEALDSFDEEARGRIRTTLPDHPVTAVWDPTAIRRVVSNLVSNALKYSPPDRPVDITVGADDAAASISVADRGIGISPEGQTRLFRRYERTSEARGSGARGLGLGLFVSHALVTAHGGEIWAESDGPGLGATFHVTLPLRVPESAPRGEAGGTQPAATEERPV
jgi:signal transduction histidine kinase